MRIKLLPMLMLSGLIAAAMLTIKSSSWLSVGLTEPGNFTVRGSKIYDPSDRVFIPKGTGLNGHNAVWPQSTLASLDNVVNCWKYNTIRIGYNLYPVKWNGKQAPQYTTNNDIDAIVQAYTRRGVVVMIVFGDDEGFSRKGHPVIDRHIQELAKRYKGNPYVWFDLYNESWLEPIDRLTPKAIDHWVSAYRHRIDLVRSQGNNNIVLVQGAAAGQDRGRWDDKEVYSGSAILQAFDRVRSGHSNVVASIHVYDQWASGDHLLRNYLARVHAKQIPMVVGEVGIDAQRGERDTTKGAEALYRAAPKTGVGIISWGYPGGNDHVLTRGKKGSGDAINSCTNPTNLTRLGQLSWKFSHANAASHPKSIGNIAQSNSKPAAPTRTASDSPQREPDQSNSKPAAPTHTASDAPRNQPSQKKPDLVITSIVPTSPVKAGSTVRFKVTVKNQGDASVKGWIGTVLAADGEYIGWAGETTAIKPGESRTFETAHPWWKATKDRFTLRALTDDKNRFDESNEQNNRYEVTN